MKNHYAQITNNQELDFSYDTAENSSEQPLAASDSLNSLNNYVKDVIYLWMNIPIESDTYKIILKIVGQKYSIGPMSVNVAIKNALDAAWFCRTVNKNHELFGYLKSNQTFPPLPSEFVVAMAALIRNGNKIE